jgi:hypothetical protein
MQFSEVPMLVVQPRALRLAPFSALLLRFLALAVLACPVASHAQSLVVDGPAPVYPGGAVNIGSYSTSSSGGPALTFHFTQDVTITSLAYDPGPGAAQELAIERASTGGLSSPGCWTGPLSAGQQCSIETAFSPVYPGLRSGTLRISTTSGVFLLPVTYNVTLPQVALTPGVLSSPITIAGQSVTQTGDSLAIDAVGNVYLGSFHDNAVRKVDAATGAVTLLAGTVGNPSNSGDGGPATSADIQFPADVAVSPAGDVYILTEFEYANDTIRRVDLSSGNISAAGGEASGRPLTKSGQPAGPGQDGAVVVDQNGTLYIAVPFLNEIAAQANGAITEIVNNPAFGATCNTSQTYTPTVLTVGGGFVYFFSNNQIFKISTDTTQCHQVISAQFGAITGLALDAAGNLYLADATNNEVRVVNANTGYISPLAGPNTYLYSVTVAQGLSSLALDPRGNLYVLGANGTVQKVDVSQATRIFDATQVGATSTDSPAYTYATNIGTTVLLAGSTSIPTNYAVDPSSTCMDSTGAYGPLGVAGACFTAVDFKPTTLGVLPGQIPFGGATINLSGPGNAPAATTTAVVSPTAIHFGTVTQGQSSGTWSVNIMNTGANPLTVVGAALTDTRDFQLGGSCSAPIAPSSSCNLTLTFTPQTAGIINANLSITDNATGGIQNVSLTGTATSNAPAIAVSPSSVNFGTLVQGTSSATWVVNVANTGGSPLSIFNIFLTDPIDYAMINRCSTSIPAYSSCNVSITFTPTGVGNEGGQLVIDLNGGLPETVVPLAGSGASLTPPIVQLSPSSINFGSVAVGGSSGVWTLYIGNTGASALNIASFTLSDTTNFHVFGTCAAIPAYGSCEETLTFTPQTHGTLNASLVLTDNATSATQSVALTGTGAYPSYTVSIAPSSMMLHPGKSGTASLVFAPTGGFTGSVTFACTGLPTGAACSFSPAALTADGSNTPQSAKLTITTVGLGSSASTRSHGNGIAFASLLGILTFGGLGRRRKIPALLFAILAFAGITTLSGCGSGIFGSITPTGNHTVSVTATATSTQKTQTGAASLSTGTQSTPLTLTIVD